MKHVLITGAGRGLGEALFIKYASSQCKVFPVVRSAEDAERLENHHLNCFPIVVDLTKDDSISTIYSFLNEHTKSLDIVINNAGISGRGHVIEKVDPQEVNALFDIHCLGPIRVVKACLEFLKNAKTPKIINISSRLGSLTRVSSGEFDHLNFSYSYRIAKASQNMLSICLGQELKKSNICVSAVHPGRLRTRGGSPDADMSAEDAAANLYEWIEQMNIDDNSGEYVEPFQGSIPW